MLEKKRTLLFYCLLWCGIASAQINLSGDAIALEELPLADLEEEVACILSDNELSSSFTFEFQLHNACERESNGRIEVVDFSGGQAPYRFSLDNEYFQPTPSFEDLAVGEHTVFVKDAKNCTVFQRFTIQVMESLVLRAEDKILTCLDDSVELKVEILQGGEGALMYIWPDGSNLPTYQANKPGIYWVEVSNGCESIFKEILVAGKKSNAKSPLYMPNVFSPNDDGYNDLYRAYIASGIQLKSYELNLYDMNGQLIFRTVDIEQGWDGVYRGEVMPSGEYYWRVQASILDCGKIQAYFKNGGLTLVR